MTKKGEFLQFIADAMNLARVTHPSFHCYGGGLSRTSDSTTLEVCWRGNFYTIAEADILERPASEVLMKPAPVG